jgi:hypothetical protein
MKNLFTIIIAMIVVAVIMAVYLAGVLFMPAIWQDKDVAFQYKRLFEETPIWAVAAPVLFAFMTVGLIVYFRPERKMVAAAVGCIVVGIVSAFYLPLALILRPFFSWMVILLPVMSVALFYVGMMYINDAKSVHPLWATFLGLLRVSVYIILSIVFLLPGCQYSETQKYESKVRDLADTARQDSEVPPRENGQRRPRQAIVHREPADQDAINLLALWRHAR